MKQPTIEQLRNEYEGVTGKAAALRWNKRTLTRKIRDARLIKAADQAEQSRTDQVEPGQIKPDFERLVATTEIHRPGDGADTSGGEPGQSPQEQTQGRGGPRPGAGRPIGQTNERARIERLMSLEKPDLGALLCVRTINKAVGRLTGVPFDVEGCELIALGFTQLLLYWFPSLEDRTGPLTLHINGIGLFVTAADKRSKQIAQLKEQKKHDEENKQEEKKPNEAQSGPGPSPNHGRSSVTRSKSPRGLHRRRPGRT